MTAFLNRSYFCTSCLIGYSNKDQHHCEAVCIQCRTELCDAKATDNNREWLKCKECLRSFKTQLCFQLHLDTKTCNSYYICRKCSGFVNMNRLPKSRKSHVCGDFYCKICSEYVSKGHVCYMKPADKPDFKDHLPEKYICYDFECQQHTGQHVPNLVVARWSCTNCIDLPLDTPDRDVKLNECEICEHSVNDREVVFKGPDTVNLFCR